MPFVEVADVDVDAHGNVYILNRGPRPVMIFDRDGDFLDSWGDYSERYFTIPHGISVAADGPVYTADNGDHTVRKWTREGKLLLTLGRVHINAPAFSGEPFNKPTGVSTGSDGDIYVSDGYGNARIHRFDASGELKLSWGALGHGPAQFNVAHSVFVDREDHDTVYVADRYNNRVQIFSCDGECLGQWANFELPNCVRRGPDGAFYVAELQHRVSVCSHDGSILARWGGTGVQVDDMETGRGKTYALPDAPSRNPMLTGRVLNDPGPGLFCAPHGIAVDAEGSIYVAEVSESFCGLDRGNRSIQKFVRV